ncbi:MAG: ATP-binding cassette domain-containing protein [Desulfotomaculaceae bacterium]|nr:ATP-binding cassette domain-containing protein [Desulfotomaculaceae bacterium]
MLDAGLTKKLWHFTLEVQLQVDNQILVLLGPSGCGKTTTLALLAGLFKPDEGFIKLSKQTLYSSEDNINKPPQSRDIGYLFQNYALFPHMTVRQNVFYGLKSKRYRQAGSALDPVELLDSFGVGHLIDRYPSMLSGGEKQRVALARALIVQPKLLLLDEPFSALDRNTKTGLRKELKKLHRQWQIPFVLVTHDEEDARFLGDIIVTIENGQVGNHSLNVVLA